MLLGNIIGRARNMSEARTIIRLSSAIANSECVRDSFGDTQKSLRFLNYVVAKLNFPSEELAKMYKNLCNKWQLGGNA